MGTSHKIQGVKSIMKEFHHIGLTGNHRDKSVYKTIEKVIHLLKIFEKKFVVDTSFNLEGYEAQTLNDLCQSCDLLFVIGGDGSFLQAARQAVKYDIPLLGFNKGRLGFLADISPQRIAENLTQIFVDKTFSDEQRHFLELVSGNQEHLIALNDLVITHDSQKHMIEYTISTGSNFICQQRGDGIIFSTPTGSTAYSLSAGGPILTPELSVNLIIPMFSHTLSMRPVVIPSEQELDIFCETRTGEQLRIIADGQEFLTTPSPNHMKIRTYEKKITLIHPRKYSFYRTLRRKLGWAKGFEGGNIER